MNKSASNRRILIVGEGLETEYNYFVGFRKEFEHILKATATSVSVARGKGGDARAIVENAIQQRKKFEPNKKRHDRVFLLLDAEGPGNAPGGGRIRELPAAEKLAAENGIEIIYSCPSFEYWLLCHFTNISRAHFADCSAVMAALNKRWSGVSNLPYDKSDLDLFARLAKLLDIARCQALKIDLHHFTTSGSVRYINPSTQVYELIAILTGSQSGEKCPITGTWKILDDFSVSKQLVKGATMPQHNDRSVRWILLFA